MRWRFKEWPANSVGDTLNEVKGGFMNKVRTIIFGSLVAGSLVATAAPALARVDWNDIVNDRTRLQTDSEELAQNRRQLDWDIDHGASSYQLDRDHRAIQNKLDDIRRDRETLRRDMSDYDFS
jgi:hypothetical protein